MPSPPRPLRAAPPLLKQWAVLVWLSACLLVAPMGGLLHALTHVPALESAQGLVQTSAQLPDQIGNAPTSSQDDAHSQDKPDHCDLCQLWDLLDATLPASFQWAAVNIRHLPPDTRQPASATVYAGNWFQSRAPPVQG